jgi:predicted GNAT family acetyltransferase
MTSASETINPLQVDLFAIEHMTERCRFRAVVDGAASELDYRVGGNVMSIMHTGVPPQLEGRGIAAALTQAALDHARAQGWKVRPLCSYAAAYMRRHPETAMLLPGD